MSQVYTDPILLDSTGQDIVEALGEIKEAIENGGSGGDDGKAYHIDDTAESSLANDDYFPFFDASAENGDGAKRSVLWSNIKSALKTYFDTLYNKITVAVSKTGTASSSTFRKQVITIDNVSTDVDGSAYMEQSVTLSTSAATTVTFTNAAIDDGAMLTVATSLWNLVPDDITLASGSCTITLPKWATAETIGVRLYVR